MMLAGKYSPAGYQIEQRARVASRDKHTLALNSRRIRPLDCDAVRGVLARQTQRAWQARGPNLLQPNQANAHQRLLFMELGPKRLGPNALHHCRVGSEVDQQPSLNRALDDWNTHERLVISANSCNPCKAPFDSPRTPGAIHTTKHRVSQPDQTLRPQA